MNEIWSVLSSDWAIRALITSCMVGITCGILGCFIVLKNMSLIGDALSHSILPGVYIAFVLVGYSTFGFFIGSVFAGLLTAIAITFIQNRGNTKSDAAIGIVFTAMFAIGVIGISSLNQKQGNHLDLKDFLFGNVMGVANDDIILSVMVLFYTVLSVIVFYRPLFMTTFQPVVAETMGVSTKSVHYFLMLLLSFAVVAALRSVGVILVVAMLITPASTALLLSHRLPTVIVISAMIGMISSIIGIVISILFDMPPGPSIVVIATVLYIASVLVAPGKGVIITWYYKNKQKQRILKEDLIKWLSKNDGLDISTLATQWNVSNAKINNALQQLKKSGWIANTTVPKLTPEGENYAMQLVRAHRLWETYQVDEMGLKSHQIHADAERLEHVLTKAQVDEIDRKLGNPLQDPHGSPIPPSQLIKPQYLSHLKLHGKSHIAIKQESDHVESELWERGLLPGSVITLHKKDKSAITIISQNKKIVIPADIAALIRVE